MARRKRNVRSGRVGTPQRYVPQPVRNVPRIAPRFLSPRPRLVLRPLRIATGDRRFFHPDPPLHRPLHAVVRSALQLVPRVSRRVSRSSMVPLGVRFKVPESVSLCDRRRRRREVLHAKGVAGRRGLRGPRRNVWSSVSCER